MNFNATLNQLVKKTFYHQACTLEIFKKLKDISNYYDLLAFVKEHSSFFIINEIIDHDWLSQFPKDTLASLNIFLNGANNLLLDKRNFTALVYNCHLTTDVLDDSVAGIKVFGTGYLEANLKGKSATAIKAYGRSSIEVVATDYAVANVSLYQKSNGHVTNEGESIVMVLNNSSGEHVFQGNEQLILK
ncbi:hypothetical protein [Christiangramia sp.]|uniref:hypothetical protein n=1 Tax=Christiangramia sp. TaxID=1931228 RepID=UPI002622473D|nr:hypothetical protein [Christiangramia sp.]